MKPIAFKVRGGGNYSGTKGGVVRPNEKGGTGALWYIDKTFTIASTQDQYIATVEPIISPTITTCKGSRGGCSDEALEEIKAVHAAREQQLFLKPPMTNPISNPQPIPQVPMRFLSVCSGMEAASVAWEPLGWKAVGFSEIEPFPCAILKHRFPNTPNYGSLTEYHTWPLGPGSIDLLVGGTPCQSFSVAGLRKGLADPRGNLALTFLGLADKLRPRWIVWENVPGVLSSDGGRDFGSFLGALEQLGYGWAYRVLDAQHFGVPQRRRRVFVVASLGGGELAASVLLKPESVCWHPAKGRKKGKGVASDAGSGVEAGGVLWSASDQPNAERYIDKAGTLNCNQGQRGGYICPSTPFRKSKRAQSASDDDAGADPSTEANTTLKASAGDQMPCVAMAFDTYNQSTSTTNQAIGSSATDVNHYGAVFTPPMAVRRLTPVECERLQGFPDNWSRIPWKGKPEEDCPDGPRYKACGNSMAVPVMRWIGEQISRVELSHNPTNQTNA